MKNNNIKNIIILGIFAWDIRCYKITFTLSKKYNVTLIVRLGEDFNNPDVYKSKRIKIIKIAPSLYKKDPLNNILFIIRSLRIALKSNCKIFYIYGIFSLPIGIIIKIFKKVKIFYDAAEYYAGMEIASNIIYKYFIKITELIGIRFVEDRKSVV